MFCLQPPAQPQKQIPGSSQDGNVTVGKLGKLQMGHSGRWKETSGPGRCRSSQLGSLGFLGTPEPGNLQRKAALQCSLQV